MAWCNGVVPKAAHSSMPLTSAPAPGGWTEFLSGKFDEVISVDPGELHPKVLALENVTHMQCRIEDVMDEIDGLVRPIGGASMFVCDMNCDARQSLRLCQAWSHSLPLEQH